MTKIPTSLSVPSAETSALFFHELAHQDTVEIPPSSTKHRQTLVDSLAAATSPNANFPAKTTGQDTYQTHDLEQDRVYVRTSPQSNSNNYSSYRAVSTLRHLSSPANTVAHHTNPVNSHTVTQTANRANPRHDQQTSNSLPQHLVHTSANSAMIHGSSLSPGKSSGISAEMENKMIQIVGAIESKNHYGAINRSPAGGGIAYGSLQVLSRTGGLGQLLQDYAAAGGRYARILLSFGNTQDEKVATRRDFQSWLTKAGQDPMMQRVQQAYFRKHYLQPALQFGKELGLQRPASYLTVFDTFIHYGANKGWLRRKMQFYVKKFGEQKGMQQWATWMRRSLQHSYGKRFGHQSMVTRYNVWRAEQLQHWLQRNPDLQGAIPIQAPNWRNRMVIR